MALVTSYPINTEENASENFLSKVNAAKDILKLLRTRLSLLKATGSPVQHELLADITKLEHALSFAVRELQKTVTKHQMVELALERSILSTLLYIPRKHFFSSNNLNDIEQDIANQLRTMITQSKSMQEMKKISDNNFIKLRARKMELVVHVHNTVEKIKNEKPTENDDDKYEKKLKTIAKINFCRELIEKIIVIKAGKHCKKLLPLARRWHTVRSISYYQNKM